MFSLVELWVAASWDLRPPGLLHALRHVALGLAQPSTAAEVCEAQPVTCVLLSTDFPKGNPCIDASVKRLDRFSHSNALTFLHVVCSRSPRRICALQRTGMTSYARCCAQTRSPLSRRRATTPLRSCAASNSRAGRRRQLRRHQYARNPAPIRTSHRQFPCIRT